MAGGQATRRGRLLRREPRQLRRAKFCTECGKPVPAGAKFCPMREAAMNCPSCGAPMRVAAGNTSLRCDYCQASSWSQADDDGRAVSGRSAGAAPARCCAVALWNAVLARSTS